MDNEANAFPSDDDVTLTIRLIMQGKEVGSIIGKKGEIVNRLRKESGAQVNISDASCTERIVSITGHPNAILKLFQLLCKSMEEEPHAGGGLTPPITLRLLLPSSQCGTLIGMGGSRIKEIREVTGANILVTSDMLPNSTERPVTITGTGDAITQCIYHICNVMMECPPREGTILYVPQPPMAGVQDYKSKPLLPDQVIVLEGVHEYKTQWKCVLPIRSNEVLKEGAGPLAGLAALGLLGLNTGSTGPNPALLALGNSQLLTNSQNNQKKSSHTDTQQSQETTIPSDLAGCIIGKGGNLSGSQLLTNSQNNQRKSSHTHTLRSQEMTISSDLAGCIIGKGGSIVAEIRQISGAAIDISTKKGSTHRTITITGNAEAVMLAEYLITMRVKIRQRFPPSSTE